MTIEEKIREMVLRQDIAAAYDKSGHAREERVERFVQAILALIEPMSQKRLARIIDLWWRDLSEKRKLSEVILAEWQKGLK